MISRELNYLDNEIVLTVANMQLHMTRKHEAAFICIRTSPSNIKVVVGDRCPQGRMDKIAAFCEQIANTQGGRIELHANHLRKLLVGEE